MTSPLPPGASLARVIPLSHHLIAEVLEPGDLAVDLTAGNGGDTVFLMDCVGRQGRVLAFDIQPTALEQTRKRIVSTGAPVFYLREEESVDHRPGVWLIQANHARLNDYLKDTPKGMIANLGYHPGGDRSVVTHGHTTVNALETGAERLAPGGRIVVVPYIGHPGGAQEAEEVEAFFAHLPSSLWTTMQITYPNRERSPFILMAEKRAG